MACQPGSSAMHAQLDHSTPFHTATSTPAYLLNIEQGALTMSVWEEAFRQALPGRGTAVGNSGRDSLQEFSLLSAQNRSFFETQSKEYVQQASLALQQPSFIKV